MDENALQHFWQAFLASRPAAGRVSIPADPPEPWSFGDSPELADSLTALVLAGTKTATAALVWEYEAEDVPLPVPGQLDIVTDGRDQPVCVIEYTAVDVTPFDQVGAEFAAREGEGDLTLEWWRDAHWRYFSRRCAVIGREPTPEMLVCCEQFRVVWQAPSV